MKRLIQYRLSHGFFPVSLISRGVRLSNWQITNHLTASTIIDLEERSDDALCRAPAVPGILPPGKIVEGEKAAGVYEGAAPPVLMAG